MPEWAWVPAFLLRMDMFGQSLFLRFDSVLVTVGMALASFWLLLAGGGVVIADDAKASINNCDIQAGPCSEALNGRMVTLDIRPRPVKAMEDLAFKVSIDTGETLSEPAHIRLNMPAMDMGVNHVNLKMITPGVHEGHGVVVRCRSGIRTWKATVVLPGIGAVDFIFDVIY